MQLLETKIPGLVVLPLGDEIWSAMVVRFDPIGLFSLGSLKGYYIPVLHRESQSRRKNLFAPLMKLVSNYAKMLLKIYSKG